MALSWHGFPGRGTNEQCAITGTKAWLLFVLAPKTRRNDEDVKLTQYNRCLLFHFPALFSLITQILILSLVGILVWHFAITYSYKAAIIPWKMMKNASKPNEQRRYLSCKSETNRCKKRGLLITNTQQMFIEELKDKRNCVREMKRWEDGGRRRKRKVKSCSFGDPLLIGEMQLPFLDFCGPILRVREWCVLKDSLSALFALLP